MYVNETIPPFHGLEDKSIKTYIIQGDLHIQYGPKQKSNCVFSKK